MDTATTPVSTPQAVLRMTSSNGGFNRQDIVPSSLSSSQLRHPESTPSKPWLTNPLTPDETHHLASVVFAITTVLDIVNLKYFFLTQ